MPCEGFELRAGEIEVRAEDVQMWAEEKAVSYTHLDVYKRQANTYLCMEQYMMAAKAELFGDSETLEQILKCSDCLLYTSRCV